MTLANSIANVQKRIANAARDSNRSNDEITLLAVTKTRSADTIREAYGLGLQQFGENYLQEARQKQAQLQDLPIEWHFIGPIQSNKTREIATHFTWVHSVDRFKIAKRLNDAAIEPINICLQVNVSDEASKSGVALNEVKQLAADITALDKLRLRGLMAIPAASESPEAQAHAFAAMQKLLIELHVEHPHMDTLSMGMSGDLEAAIAEGATVVRIGTDIFGPRTQSPQ